MATSLPRLPEQLKVSEVISQVGSTFAATGERIASTTVPLRPAKEWLALFVDQFKYLAPE